MAGLEELKKKLAPLFDADKGLPTGLSIDNCDSYMVISIYYSRRFQLWLIGINIALLRFKV